MELQTYLTILWRRKWIIAITTFVTIAIVGLGTSRIEPLFAASGTLRVSTNDVDGIRSGEVAYADRVMNTYGAILQSRAVKSALKQSLGIDDLPEISVTFVANTELMQITAKDPNPVLAARVVNAAAEILIDQARRTRSGRRFNLSLADPAVPPRSPVTPRWGFNLLLGAMVGLIGGLGLAFLFENLDTTLHSTEQIETVTGLATLGQIPFFRNRSQSALVNGNPRSGEAFQRLRTNILTLHNGTVLKAFLITSAEPGDGKSTIVANLAMAIAKSGRKIIVVDSDLRLPTLHKIFELNNEVGLSNVLRHEVPLPEAIQYSHIAGVQVLTSGPLPPNPVDLLDTPQMEALIEYLKKHFDLVLLDTPALLPVIDAAVLAPMVDGVVMIIRRAQTRQEAVQAAQQQLNTVKAVPVGIVVNQAQYDSSYDYYHHMLPQTKK
jgi:capsular exopolysaccharide synthesis family protein